MFYSDKKAKGALYSSCMKLYVIAKKVDCKMINGAQVKVINVCLFVHPSRRVVSIRC